MKSMYFDKGTIFPDKGTLFSAFPWGSNQYRLSANLYLGHSRQTFTEIEVKEVVAERTYGNYVVDAVSWISPFWIHTKVVDHMRQGSIFLAGDAAAIQSPVGGQGMNTGLQDAHNLAWKLALVINTKSNPSLLDTYQSERYPIVSEIVNQTEFFTQMMLFDKSFYSKLHKFSQKIVDDSALSKKIGTQLTQLSIQYKDSPVIDYQEEVSANAPRPGERAPNVIMNKSKK
jgi:2-polyprenyl-6-methoxyphenol hydroxylase-like FAD-dependent oxidoreductase